MFTYLQTIDWYYTQERQIARGFAEWVQDIGKQTLSQFIPFMANINEDDRISQVENTWVYKPLSGKLVVKLPKPTSSEAPSMKAARAPKSSFMDGEFW